MIGRAWPFVDARTVLAIQAVLLREERIRDTHRIYSLAYADLPALRRRMLHGTSPRDNMLRQVAPIWATAGRIPGGSR